MRHHTVTATLATPPDEVFVYLSDIEKLPQWATEFARELRLVDGRHKVVNGLGEFFFEIRADAESGVIDMLAGPTKTRSSASPRVLSPPRTAAAPSPSLCSRRPARPRSSSKTSTPRYYASSRIWSDASVQPTSSAPGEPVSNRGGARPLLP